MDSSVASKQVQNGIVANKDGKRKEKGSEEKSQNYLMKKLTSFSKE